jgi:energy-coupling factor transporter ATP-binding protein EcfA2
MAGAAGQAAAHEVAGAAGQAAAQGMAGPAGQAAAQGLAGAAGQAPPAQAGAAPVAHAAPVEASFGPPAPVAEPPRVHGEVLGGPTVVTPARSAAPAPAFVDAGAIRSAARSAGLRLPDGVYANVAAALSSGKHLLLTGAPGSGKTTLAMAVARAAAQAGRAHGATVTTGAPPQALILEAAERGRWVIADELDRADPDEALGALSTFLAGIPVAIEGAEEAKSADGWRIVATWGGGAPRGSALRRFAVVDVAAPPADQLRAALHEAAGGDPNAAHAAERLLALADLAPIGTGVFLAAARHAAARRAVVPADDLTLAREAYTAYIAPLLTDLDHDGERRIRELLG